MPSSGMPPRRKTIVAILPRADHLREYELLLQALAADPDIRTVVVTSPGLQTIATTSLTYRRCQFYLDGSAGRGMFRWAWLLVCREWTARRLLASMRHPAAMVVPSDVADAMLPFVEAAQRHGVPVAYVQGAVVFPDYPELNAQMYAERWQALSAGSRRLRALLRVALRLCGIHATVESKDVLGCRADRVLLMSEAQREIHRQAGVPVDRIRVTGAPFVDRLIALRRGFDAPARQRMRESLGLGDRPLALFVTKTRFRLSPDGSREIHAAVIRDVVEAIRRELPGWVCVVKLHPNEPIADYQWLIDEADPLVTVVREHPVEDLLLLSSLTLSLGTSSPAFAAAIIGCPLVLVNFTDAAMLDAHSDFAAIARTVRSPSELRLVLKEIAESAEAAARLKVPSIVEDRWADGRACERIVTHLRELAMTS